MADDERREHRRHLVEAYHAASRDYDRAIMTLSAAALGVSIVFVRDVAPRPTGTGFLAWSWMLFTASLLTILASFLTSQEALRYELETLDDQEEGRRGGKWGVATTGLNIASGVGLVAGVICLVWFAVLNV